ncbi:LamG-like jellyroll fold domain-containing protein, partial [uncultured Fibrobacter sp.]|uniref:LamG-like jellyroll fold domain-containing protein n=1 Tax=uncultured Fibrobacter sp. TaxID=261512 RepID=UPI0025FCA399
MGFSVIGGAVATGFDDLAESHMMPLYKKNLEKWFGNTNSFSLVNAGGSEYTPYLMEDFLYERPFVNLALLDSATLNKLQGMSSSDRKKSTLNRNCYYLSDRENARCAVGLFANSGDLNSTHKMQSVASLSPLRFKSSSDWSRMGVKVDRWEKVDGLTPEGKDTSNYVPIRHIERYEVPAITVEDWIEKYSFVVDDLMPHRLRQIRMNFNYQEEIAWECDITKPDTSSTACTVYKRSGGGSWENPIVLVDSVMQVDESGDSVKVERKTTIDKVPHPVKKNGQFDFIATDFYPNLLAIQKDNQNTVTISTVNKIGLSNTQRFYYLFKATANMLEPKWPLRGVALNKMKGFCSYASALGYQGFRVVGAKDKILTDSMGTYENLTENVDMQMAVSEFRDASGKLLYDSSSATFVSQQPAIDLTEGSYVWKYAASIENIESPSSHADTSNTYEVPFRIDRTPPKFEVVPESPLINPDSTPFVARFKWADSALATPDIRAMRWTLERASGQSSGSTFVHVCDFRSLYEVSTPDFAVAWNDNCRAEVKKYGDGLYRVKAFAVDYAVPDSNVYKKMNGLVNAIAASPNYVEQSRWPTVADSVNTSMEYASFTIDSHKPSLVLDSPKSVFTATADSLLKIAYVVHDQYFGPDSTPVTVRWDFVHAADKSKADRAGDSVWVKNDSVVGAWEESGSMRLEDGSYVLRAQVRDDAGNDSVYENLANLRVDKTVPYIESLVSSSLISPDSATLKVNEKFDVPSNRFGVDCRYRILGGDADTNWHDVPRDSAKQYERVFALDSAVIGVSHGKRYLEVACKDAVGNVSYRTDLFHVGGRYPTITSPDGSEMITTALVAITGMAPPSGRSDSEHAIFRLRYRNVDGLVPEHAAWQMSQAYVAQALRSGTQNVSRAAQVNEGVLGYIDRSTFEGEKIVGTYEIELSTCTADTASCYADTSLWISDTMTVSFNMVSHEVNDEKPTVKFVLRVRDTLNPVSMTVGKDSLDISLTLSGAFKNNYLIRVYAEGDDHVGIFEKSVSKAFRNPYYGFPADTAKSKGVWFYQDSLGYHLKWKGLPEGDSLKVSFASDRFGNTCESAAGGANLGSCVVRASAFNFVDLPTVTRSYLEDFPEWIPPSYVDSVMILAGDSGHILMTAEAAFQVLFVRDFADTSKSKIPVYFASSAKDGFYWGDLSLVSSDTLDPLVTGWTVNPQTYGLGFRWNGLMATDGYLSADSVKIFAEVTENISENPYIYIDSAVIALDKAPAEIVLANKLADYVVLVKDSASATLDDSTQNKIDFRLGSMNFYYGLKNQDAHVGITIWKGSTLIAELQDSATLVRAKASDSAYQMKWNGKNDDGNASLSAGTYKIKISAVQLDGTTVPPKYATFKVKTAKNILDMTPENPKDTTGRNSAVYVAEAFLDSTGVYRYEPMADYRIDASVRGYRLPNEGLKNEIPLSGTVSGTQEIIGYEPKRFSLALKRHRKKLDLVVVSRRKGKLDKITGSVFCEETGNYDFDSVRTDVLHFDSEHRDTTVAYILNYGGSGYGFDGSNGPGDGTIDIAVMTVSEFERQFKTLPSSAADFEKARNNSVWKLTDFTDDSSEYKIPGNTSKGLDLGYNKDLGCNVVMKDSILDSTCVYGKSGTTTGYDPNKSLFKLSIKPNADGKFYSQKGKINSHCGDDGWLRYTYQQVNVVFEIPKDDYWDAPIGMDNLVNRTIRFDHTNKTIFAKNASSPDGYFAAMDNLAGVKNDAYYREVNSYHDGSAFVFDKTYGLLTPFETQSLHFFPASVFEGGLNMFLFADEDSKHTQDARFEMRFYGGENSQDYFVAKAIGLPVVGESEVACNYDTLTNVLLGMGGQKYCQIDHDSKTSNIKSTPYFSGYSNVQFYVGRNMVWSAETQRDTIPYPAQANWRDTLKSKECKDSGQDWKFAENGSKPCYKYYDFGSRVHYYFADYVDSVWTKEILRTTNGSVLSDSVIANLANSPWKITRNPLSFSFARNVDKSRIGSNDVSGLNVKLDPDMYDVTEHRFFAPLDSVRLVNSQLVGGGVNAHVDNLKSGKYPSLITFSGDEDSLYVKATTFTKNIAYRKSKDPFAKPLVRPLQDTIPFSRLYTKPEWGREIVLKSAKLVQLDGSEHTHFNLLATPNDSLPLYVAFKRADSIPFHRLEEFVELYAYLEANRMYSLSYLNDTSFYSIKDSIEVNTAGWRSLGWFNVNRLQGNTTFLLTWGDKSGASYNFSKFDMVIGARATSSGSKTVQSPLGEVSVSFPTNSLDGDKDVTIRSIDAKNYPFEVFNNLALNGPIMEALPRMTFADTVNLPRVQMKISKEEMEAMHTSPETIKLYKVDFTQKKFVPLENALYGYLDADGHALLKNGFASDTAATCSTATDTRCYNKNKEWAYLLISAETRSFSVFTALDSAVAETPDYSIKVVPEVADVENRLILVTGISRYNLYVDDDAVWANRNDSTPPEALAYTLDSNGYAHVQLPSRGNALDTNYVFAVALSEPDTNGNVSELPAAPAVARAITVNTQFACHVPQDSLWLGLDNGYLAYAAGCTHPGYGIVSLYADGKLTAEFRGNMPDTLVYDGLLKTGGTDIGKIPYGVYESRYVGVSALGMDKQMAGPRIYTDSVRPSIDSFNVAVQSELLDRIFRVSASLSDAESGIARVKITPVLGNKELKVIDALPDSAGFVNVSLRLTRKQLTDCSGCRLSLSFRVEDYGHNYNVRDYFSENLYPFPMELALWYPAYEGSGNRVQEIINGVHNLDVTRMNNKWGSDVGLYFSQKTDYAVGKNGTVDFGSTNSYSFEARIKPGNPNDNAWHEILSFKGVNALDIRLLQNKRALMLVEGSHNWKTGSILPITNKSWSHVVVTVDSDSVKFYVDGESKAARNSGISLEREMEGVFSMGKAGSEPSYIGNIADIRMYSRALTAAEVEELSKPVTDEGEASDVIVVAVKDMDAVSGFSNEFSCSVAGNKYLVSGDSATLAMSVIVENAADYNVVLYARSATVGDKSIYVGESNLLAGMAAVSNTWRAVTVSGVSVHLAAGTHTLTLKVPA